MAKKPKTAITPVRSDNYPEWYQQVIKAADLAENSSVRGCMVIKPWGYGIWENIRTHFDAIIKKRGVQNAYFPLLIPKSYLEKEAEHVDGFAKECAVVTHHRLEDDGAGGLKPAGELAEPFVIRPTSETIIGESFSNWVQSYRDLPLKINQWANVMRWEMRPRLFLRTSEFLWQEGHTVHATAECAATEASEMLEIYANFAENMLALPVIMGEKTPDERFPGAKHTYTIEAMMQDGKALQAGTSHDLGQNFAIASDIKFSNQDGHVVHAHTTSWGISTRLIGGIIMAHGDDDGMIVPPKVAAQQVVIIPAVHDEADREAIMEKCLGLKLVLETISFDNIMISAVIDDRDEVTSTKSWNWIKKGIPVRVEIGKREIEGNQVFFKRRDESPREKHIMPEDEFLGSIADILLSIQNNLLERAKSYRAQKMKKIDSLDEIFNYFKSEDAGFANIPHSLWDEGLSEKMKTDFSVSPRCLPIIDGELSDRLIIARSY